MGAKIFCNICEVLIKDVALNELGTITGEEICKDCGARVEAAFEKLEALGEKFQSDLAKIYEQAKAQFEVADKARADFGTRGEQLHTRMLADLKTLRDSIIKTAEERRLEEEDDD